MIRALSIHEAAKGLIAAAYLSCAARGRGRTGARTFYDGRGFSSVVTRVRRRNIAAHGSATVKPWRAKLYDDPWSRRMYLLRKPNCP
jgi:hypothetical protein